jgi:hypothetical protein
MEAEILKPIALYAHMAGDLCAIVQCIRVGPKYNKKTREYRNSEGENAVEPSFWKDFTKPVFFYGWVPLNAIALGSVIAYEILV